MKQIGSKFRFYWLIGMMNIAVVTMFYTVNLPRPVAAASTIPMVSRRLPVAPRIIPAKVGTPTHLKISSVSIDLPVGIGTYDKKTNSWTTSLSKAYYADASMPINDSNGTTLIYGHAQTPVFGRLPAIHPGAKALVYTDTGYVFRYSFLSMKEVLPTDTTVFRADGLPTLVLQTCTGDWDAYRALFKFKLEAVEKI